VYQNHSRNPENLHLPDNVRGEISVCNLHQLGRNKTATTTLYLTPSSRCSRPNWSRNAAPGGVSTKSNWPLWNGCGGSTTNASTPDWTTEPQRELKQSITLDTPRVSPRYPRKTTGTKPKAIKAVTITRCLTSTPA
jgi:hypothetical protein